MNPEISFDFEAHTPPPLTESSLLAERERRRLHRQTALLALAALMTQVGLILLSASLLTTGRTALAAGCFAYAIACTAGSGLLAAVFEGKREVFDV